MDKRLCSDLLLVRYRVLGQGSYGMVKLAYNREEDKNYVSARCLL